MQQTYDDIATGGYSMPIVAAVLEAWALSHTTRQWPAWASLKSALDAEVRRCQPLALPPSVSALRRPLPPIDPWLERQRGETFAEHVERTCGKGSPGWGTAHPGLRQSTYDLGMSMVRRQEGDA